MLKLENVHRSVGNSHIIKGVDLELKSGQAIGLVWPNGCGKTSLLNMINGFNAIQEGKMIFDYQDVTWIGVEQRANKWIGRVFQNFGIFKNLTLYENLATAYISRLSWKHKILPVKFLPKEIKSEIDDILHELDLFDKRHELAWNLSWWQMRLLEIGRLYLQKTKLYLLDEPTAGISPKLKGKVIELLNKIIARGKIVIIVEHDFEFLAEFVDRFCVMNDGKVVLEWDYATIKNSSLIKDIYFGKNKVISHDGILERAELVRENK